MLFHPQYSSSGPNTGDGAGRGPWTTLGRVRASSQGYDMHCVSAEKQSDESLAISNKSRRRLVSHCGM